MAVLSKATCPGGWGQLPDEKLDDYLKRTEAMLQRLLAKSREAAADGKAAGIVLQFPVADGRAYYVVVREKPLTLQHIPFGDGWRIPAAHVRGLTLRDVRDQARWICLEAELTGTKRGED